MSAPIDGVYLSGTLDLAGMFGAAFAPFADKVRLRTPDAIDDPETVRFAFAWLPPPDAFRRYPNCVMVSSIAAGVDSLLGCPSLPAKSVVTRVRDDAQAQLMAGFAVWHLVWHHRNMGAILADVRECAWRWRGTPLDLAPDGRPVGILGFGLMGRAIARAVAALGFPVFAASRSPVSDAGPGITVLSAPDAVQQVAEKATTLINVLPLTQATRGILNRDLFARMPRGAVLIQLGRGDHLVEADLDAALDSGQISAASLDVFATEPLPPAHPWWRHPKILVTPHLASDTSPEFVAAQVVQSLGEVLAGRIPFNAVNRSNGY
ncbi:MAG: hydroxyacid dehydrogenase [Hyphomicrobiales bacterium]|nr:MAG: hydroxyacid dehydrogenase [Hyphomicrobiales bacterium]